MSRSCLGRPSMQGGNYQRISRSSSFSNRNVGCGNYSVDPHGISKKFHDRRYSMGAEGAERGPSSKRRKTLPSTWEGNRGRCYEIRNSAGNVPSTSSDVCAGTSGAKGNSGIELGTYRHEPLRSEDVEGFMSRDEIERFSPSRKDGIDLLRETHLRYSYCSFLQNLGLRLELPQTTIATAMILCHRFFVRRSHACHDRFLIATAALFLAAKSEETPHPLNNVLKTSYEICYKQDPTRLPYYLPIDWFEQYRERIIEAEQMILTTLNFELNVQHPYVPLTDALNKLGLSGTILVNLAWGLVNEGLRSSLWLQFKPHHIAAGAAFLAAKFLNFDLSSYQRMWQEFQTTPAVVQDVAQQLMELF